MNNKAYKQLRWFSLIQVFALFWVLSTSLTVKAYEQDTHLRLTYLIARSTGINDEVSKFLAYGNQNIDQTAISSAMLLPPQRALFHFTGSFQVLKNSAHGGSGVFDRLKQLFWSRKITIAERNHAVGSMMIYQGLVDGDLQKISAGLHTKMDTYGHAGYTNAWGHMFDGHNPDRVFLETEKYRDMVRALTQSMVAIRNALPEEALDKSGALKFLNKFREDSALKEELTTADLQDATKISSVLTASSELKKLYAENTFNNYAFKKLALKLIFDDFKARGIFSSDVTFDEIFPVDILKIRQMDTASTIIAVVMEDLQTGFLKTSSGKNIFNTEKMFQQFAGGTTDEFLAKLDLESKRFAQRIRDFEHARIRLKNRKNFSSDETFELAQEAVAKEHVELSQGLNIANIDEEIASVMSNAKIEIQQEIKRLELEITVRYEEIVKPLFDKLDREAMLSGESKLAIEQITKFAEDMKNEITEMKRSKLIDTFIEIRSRQLAQYKFASELANKLTKDFIPQKYTQYFKQLFESETYTRVFETYYKDEAWRRFIFSNFGVNWVNANQHSVLTDWVSMGAKFKKMMNRRSAVMLVRTNRTLLTEAQKAAELLIPGDIPSRDEAQKIQFNRLGHATFNYKMFRYLGLGVSFLPYVGEKYLQYIYRVAEKKAKLHEVEDIKENISKGKYKVIDISGNTKVQLQQMAAPNKCVKLFL